MRGIMVDIIAATAAIYFLSLGVISVSGLLRVLVWRIPVLHEVLNRTLLLFIFLAAAAYYVLDAEQDRHCESPSLDIEFRDVLRHCPGPECESEGRLASNDPGRSGIATPRKPFTRVGSGEISQTSA